MANNKIIRETNIRETVDSEGNIIESTKSEVTRNVAKSDEPDYIKLYTKMWCEFNNIPSTYRELFLQLVTRMSYCNAQDLANSQIVYTGKPVSDVIMASLNWKKAMYQRGLKALTDCGAIKKINRGVYQINPSYAGKGEWRYNPKYDRGGVEDLIATFNFKQGTVNTKIIWADDGSDNEMNTIMRDGMNVDPENQTVLKTTDYPTVDIDDIKETFDNAENCPDTTKTFSRTG